MDKNKYVIILLSLLLFSCKSNNNFDAKNQFENTFQEICMEFKRDNKELVESNAGMLLLKVIHQEILAFSYVNDALCVSKRHIILIN